MELEQLKQQWDIIQKKLDEQQIINKRLMENAVTQKIDFINTYNWIGIIILSLIIPIVFIIGPKKNVEPFLLYLIIGLLITGLVTGIYHALLFNKAKNYQNNILTTEKFIIFYERFSYWYYLIAIVLVFVFFTASVIIFYDRLIEYNRLWFFITLALGGILLSFGEMKWFLTKIKRLHQSISDLKEFEKE